MIHELFTPYVFGGLYAFAVVGVTYFLAVVGVTAILCMIMNKMNLPKANQ